MLNKSIHETLLEKFPQAFKKTDRKRALEALFLTSITNETSVLFAEPLISETKKRNSRLISQYKIYKKYSILLLYYYWYNNITENS